MISENCCEESVCVVNKCLHSNCDVVNMATTAHVTTNIMGCEKFNGSESDLEDFIDNFERYSDIMGIAEERKIVMVTVFMTPSAIKKYSEIDSKNYKEKLKAAFTKEKSILDTMKELVNLRWGSSNLEETYKKAEELVNILTKEKLSKKELLNLACLNMVDSYEIKKELKLRGTTETKDIKSVVTNMYELRKMESEETVAAYTTVNKQDNWNTVTRRKAVHNERTPHRHYEHNNRNQGNNGFKPKNNYYRTVKCYACQEEGHIRRDCPNVKCTHCNRNGHYRTQCYLNKNRFKEREQYSRNSDWKKKNNAGYHNRPQNRQYPVAEIDECNDDSEYEETRSNQGKLTKRVFPDKRQRYENDQGNEEARSQGEVINVLH